MTSKITSSTAPDTTGAHITTTRNHLQHDLDALRTDLLDMGFETETMLRDAIEAIIQLNPKVADDILRRDDGIDEIEARIEAECLHLLATQQPLAPDDLRLITTAMKVASDVERVGDNTVNIAKAARRLSQQGILYRPLIDLPRLSEMTRLMLHDAMEAIVHRDTLRAQSVIDADDAVDSLYKRMRGDLQAAMERDPSNVILASSLMFVVHYLERISDHCVGIAERLFYLETGAARPRKSQRTARQESDLAPKRYGEV